MSSCVKAQDARTTTQRRRVTGTNDVILSQAFRNGSSTVLATGPNDDKSLEVREVDSLMRCLTALSLFAVNILESQQSTPAGVNPGRALLRPARRGVLWDVLIVHHSEALGGDPVTTIP